MPAPFVGRDPEMAALRAAVDDAVAGMGRLILLSGEAGIGKTRTAEELARYAQGRDAQVLWGRCYEGEGAPAFWPWLELLRAATRALSPEELHVAVGNAPELVQLLPALRDQLPNPPEPSASASAESRFRLFEAVATLLGRVAQVRALLVIIDDLQGADPSSLLLLEFVTRTVRNMPVLLLATHRQAETRHPHPLSDSLIELAREATTQRIELHGLTREEVARLLQASMGSEAPEVLVTQLYERTEGNPLFVGEFVRALAAEQRRQRANPPTPLTDITIPHGVRAVIERRMSPLSTPCHTLLRAAAVIGREFSWQVLDSVLPLAPRGEVAPQADVEELLEEAQNAGIVSRSSDAPGRARFTHALIRETLYDGLRVGDRARLHRAVGDATERLARTDEHLAELAYHFSEAARGGADDTDRAVRYAQRAAEHAMRVHAYEEAVRLYRLALVELERRAEVDAARKCALLVDLGVAQNASGTLDVAKQTLLQASELAKANGFRDELARAALNFGSRLPWGEGPEVDPVRLGLIESALEPWAGTETATEANLLARLGTSLRFSPEQARREAAGVRALALARRLGDTATLMAGLNARYVTAHSPDSSAERRSIAAELAEIARRAGDLEMLFEAEGWRLDHAAELGHRDAWDAAFAIRQRVAKELRQPYCNWLNQAMAASLLMLEGRFADAERGAEEALAVGLTANPGAVVGHAFQMAVLRLTQMDRAGLESAVEILTRFAAHSPFALATTQLAWSLAELGRDAEARRWFDRLALADFRDIPFDQIWLVEMGHLAAACALLNDTEHAPALYERLEPYASRAMVTPSGGFFQGPVALRLGSLAAILERPQAADHFERALEMNVRMRARPWLARTQYEYARMLLASGGAEDEQRAAALLADALATARELDMPLLQERVLGVGGPVSAPPDSARASGAGARISTPIPDTRSPTPDSVFCREGDYWTIAYAGKVLRLKDSKGVQYLAHLLGHPGQEFLALDLVQGLGVSAQGAAGNGAGTGTQGAWAADPGLPALDAQARREYRQRLAELRDELTEAEEFNDLARATKLRLEIELLGQQLAAALDLRGRDRKAGAASERGRLMVTKRIKSVLKTLDRLHPPLAHHLRACVKTGYCCVYTPPPGQPVVWHT